MNQLSRINIWLIQHLFYPNTMERSPHLVLTERRLQLLQMLWIGELAAALLQSEITVNYTLWAFVIHSNTYLTFIFGTFVLKNLNTDTIIQVKSPLSITFFFIFNPSHHFLGQSSQCSITGVRFYFLFYFFQYYFSVKTFTLKPVQNSPYK